MKIYRWIIDGLVVALAIFVFGPYLWSFIPFEYVDDTLPDDIVAYNTAMEPFLLGVTSNFQTLLANPTGASRSYTFRTREDRKPMTAEEIFEESKHSVVIIETVDEYSDWYSGAGVILSADGLIATNYHVIFDAEKAAVSTYDREVFEITEVVAYDEALDIAFVKIDATDLKPLPIGDSDALAIGERMYSIGHPEGLNYSFVEGIMSGLRDYSSRGEGVQIQMTNPTSAGNSGGALINSYGELVGIPTWSLEYEDNLISVQNINFSISINEVLGLLE